MKTGKQIQFTSVYNAFIKKHYCPDCKTRLKRTYVTETVNSKSADAKNHDFSLRRHTFLHGDVDFTLVHFVCPNCGLDMNEYSGKITRAGDEDKKFEWL